MPKSNVIHVSDNSYEWFTPVNIIEAARGVMGRIDCDPASCLEANAVIGAEMFYTKDEDGLTFSWFGNVWLNPPYNMPLIEMFSARVVSEYQKGNIISAIVLVNNSTDTKWFHLLLEASSAICLIRRRMKFWNGDKILAARQGQAIFYLGTNLNKFAGVFSDFGAVMSC